MAPTIDEVLKGLENDDFSAFSEWYRSCRNNICHIFANGTTLLSNAVRKSNLRALSNVLKQGASINQRESGGASPLLIAIHLNRFDVIQHLVKAGADIAMRDSYDTPLTVAVREGNLDIIEFLIDNGADVTECDVKGMSPLFQAIRDGKLAVVNLFLNKGVGQDLIDGDGNTPLILAIRKELMDLIDCLLKHGVDVNETKNEKTPLAWAAEKGNLEIVKILLAKRANINALSSDGINTALATAVRYKQPEIVKYLTNKGANICKVGENGKTPLLWAVINEDLDMIDWYLDHGAEYVMDTVFLDAIAIKNLGVVKLLKNRGADSTDKETSSLKMAVKTGNVEIAKYLIESGAKVVDDLNQKEITTAIELLKGNQIDMLKVLVENGARLTETGDCGETLLTKAILLEDFDIIKYLIRQGASVNQPNRQGLTPLVTAEKTNNFKIFQYLVDCGATLSTEEAKDAKLSRRYQMAKENSLRREKLKGMCSNQEAAES